MLCPEARLPRLAALLATLASAGSGAVPGRLPLPPVCAAVEALLSGRLLLLPRQTEAGRLPLLDATAGELGERQRAGRLGELRQVARRAWRGEEARMAGLVGEHCRRVESRSKPQGQTWARPGRTLLVDKPYQVAASPSEPVGMHLPLSTHSPLRLAGWSVSCPQPRRQRQRPALAP